MTAENTVWISAKISPAHMAKLDALADATRTNRSEVLRMLIEAVEVGSIPAMRYANPSEAPCPQQ